MKYANTLNDEEKFQEVIELLERAEESFTNSHDIFVQFLKFDQRFQTSVDCVVNSKIIAQFFELTTQSP